MTRGLRNGYMLWGIGPLIPVTLKDSQVSRTLSTQAVSMSSVFTSAERDTETTRCLYVYLSSLLTIFSLYNYHLSPTSSQLWIFPPFYTVTYEISRCGIIMIKHYVML